MKDDPLVKLTVGDHLVLSMRLSHLQKFHRLQVGYRIKDGKPQWRVFGITLSDGPSTSLLTHHP